jgi:hypothetical protein
LPRITIHHTLTSPPKRWSNICRARSCSESSSRISAQLGEDGVVFAAFVDHDTAGAGDHRLQGRVFELAEEPLVGVNQVLGDIGEAQGVG